MRSQVLLILVFCTMNVNRREVELWCSALRVQLTLILETHAEHWTCYVHEEFWHLKHLL